MIKQSSRKQEDLSIANPQKSYKISIFFYLFAFVSIDLFWYPSCMLKVFSKFSQLSQKFKMILHPLNKNRRL